MNLRITAFTLALILMAACSQVPAKNSDVPEQTPPSANAPRTMTENTPDSPQEENTVANQYNELSPSEAQVILYKGTDRPGNGGYTLTDDAGVYLCRQCNAKLYRSDDKFESHCGWPSFDDEVDGAVTQVPDADGRRVEIICSNCDGHLGHVFTGERMTSKNVRHCVNTSSMSFIPQGEPIPAKIVLPE